MSYFDRIQSQIDRQLGSLSGRTRALDPEVCQPDQNPPVSSEFGLTSPDLPSEVFQTEDD